MPKIKTFSQYTKATMRTAPTDIKSIHSRYNVSMGIAGESGEVVDAMKKEMFQGRTAETTRAAVVEEVGDVLWYLTQALRIYDATLEEAASKNIEKLWARYPANGLVGDSK